MFLLTVLGLCIKNDEVRTLIIYIYGLEDFEIYGMSDKKF